MTNTNATSPSTATSSTSTIPEVHALNGTVAPNTIIRVLPTPLSLDDFEVGVTLGTGSFGRVRFAIHKVSLLQHLTNYFKCN